jgi:2-dehydropantoate 2-reductase
LKHAILGAGAVGGLIGAALAHEGHHVTVLVRPESLARHPSQLCLERLSGKIEAPIRLATKLSTDVDVLWIAVKAHQLVPALNAIPSHGPRIATIVPLLNGMEHVELLRSRFDRDRVVPATISVESERLAPGRVVQRSSFVRLALSAAGEHKLESVAARLRQAGFSCEFQANEKTMLWSKLAFLAPFALTGTASDKDKQGIFADPAWRGRLECAVGEACAVAAADGAAVDREKILATLESLPAAMRTSMQKDVSAGRMPELDAIGGPIIRGGRRHRLDVPTTRELVARIEERLNKEFPQDTSPVRISKKTR